MIISFQFNPGTHDALFCPKKNRPLCIPKMCSRVQTFAFRGETTDACLVRVETTHAQLHSRGNPWKLLKTHCHWLTTLIESTETTQNSLPLANDANRIHGNYSCTSQNL